MKIRDGHVSNSSSSSFIVKYSEFDFRERVSKVLLGEEFRILLESYGFRLTWVSHPQRLLDRYDEDSNLPDTIWDISGDHFGLSYGFFVSCNEDEVIEWLLRHGISFQAATHYGHWSWYYDGISDYVIKVPNLGNYFDTYGISKMEKMRDSLSEEAFIKYCLPEKILISELISGNVDKGESI